jgi:hypothetical protein
MAEKMEFITMNLNARKKCELGGIIRNALRMKTGGDDFAKLDLGFEVPKDYLTIAGPQPTLAELTVICGKLELPQLRITSVELITQQQIDAENAVAKKTAEAAAGK